MGKPLLHLNLSLQALESTKSNSTNASQPSISHIPPQPHLHLHTPLGHNRRRPHKVPLEPRLRPHQPKIIRHQQMHQRVLQRKRRIPAPRARQPRRPPEHVLPVHIRVLCARVVGCAGRHEPVRVEGVRVGIVRGVAHHGALRDGDEVAGAHVEAARESVGPHCFALDVHCGSGVSAGGAWLGRGSAYGRRWSLAERTRAGNTP
jgi:hypothetical protein